MREADLWGTNTEAQRGFLCSGSWDKIQFENVWMGIKEKWDNNKK